MPIRPHFLALPQTERGGHFGPFCERRSLTFCPQGPTAWGWTASWQTTWQDQRFAGSAQRVVADVNRLVLKLRRFENWRALMSKQLGAPLGHGGASRQSGLEAKEKARRAIL